MPVGKEAETAETFDEDAYRDELIDKEGYSDETARMKAKKKKESLAARVGKIEINLGSLTKAKKKVWVKATATKKGHYREQEAGRKRENDTKELKSMIKKAHSERDTVWRKYLSALKSDDTKSARALKEKHDSLNDLANQLTNDLRSLSKGENVDIEHLSPEERKKRQKDRDKRQKERAAHRAVRQKQHDEVEEGIPEGK